MAERRIKAIIFDLGGVLCMAAPKYFLGELQIKRDIPIATSLISWKKFWPQFKLGKITEEQFWKSFAEDLLIKVPEDIIVKEFKDLIRLFLIPVDEIFDYARGLRGKFKLGILSNNPKEWVEYLQEHYKIDAQFDAIYSYAVDSVKPEKHIYEVLLSKMKLKGHQCVFVDNSERNLVTAQELGMETIQFTNLDKLQSDLRKIVGGEKK